jgi:hypothetical protein
MTFFDPILLEFLRRNYAEARALAAQSDVLTLVSVSGEQIPAQLLCYLRGIPHLLQRPDGIVETVTNGEIAVGIHFPPDYLRSTDRWLYLKLISLLWPPTFFHPNVQAPVLCPGARLYPAMRLTDLLWHIYDIVTYGNTNLDERDALNPQACRYLRLHPEILAYLRPPPLRKRRFQVTTLPTPLSIEGTAHVDEPL